MASALTDDPAFFAHPLRTVRRLTDQALDDLGGLVAAAESADANGLLPRCSVRLVLLQALCGVRSDIEIAQRLCNDEGCRWFVGLHHDITDLSAADCAQMRRSVLDVDGFDEFLRVLVGMFERRGLLVDATFAPDQGVLRGVLAGSALVSPDR